MSPSSQVANSQLHTPGNWRLSPQALDWVIYGGSGQFVARVDASETQSAEEGLANARLIASAPALLEALTELHAWALTVSDGEARNQEELCLARSALKQATGQT